jgi:hypothetical protein
MRLALAFLLVGCAHRGAVRLQVAAGTRLGWVVWSDPNTLVSCAHRVDDSGGIIGDPGPCKMNVAGEGSKPVAAPAVGRMDSTSPQKTPDARCSIELVPAHLTPPAAPARAYWQTPSGRELIAEWNPEAKLEADQYQLETAISPEGQWMAIIYLAIGRGEGELRVDIPRVELRAIPACK